MIENVEHPNHYTWLKEACGIEVIDITRHFDFDIGNAIKYLLRAGRKQESGLSNKDKQIEDLQKAVWYIKDKIKMLNNEYQIMKEYIVIEYFNGIVNIVNDKDGFPKVFKSEEEAKKEASKCQNGKVVSLTNN